MKKLFAVAATILFMAVNTWGQISSTPQFFSDNEPITLTFDATQGNGGLAGYTGDVYGHMGLITSNSTNGKDWKYVLSEWGENTSNTKWTRDSQNPDLYTLTISTSVRNYYGVTDSSEEIKQLAFVMRSGDSSKEGKADGGADIYVDLSQGDFTVVLNKPQNNKIYELNETLTIEASASELAELSLSINGTQVAQTTGTSISYSESITESKNMWIAVYATLDGETYGDSVFATVKQDPIVESKPAAYKKGINYIDDNTAALVLWAPEKEYVYVLGDFNDWHPNNDYLMKKDGDYFWMEITDLLKGKPYVFQYLIDGNIQIADPYTEQTSDPDHDHWISNTTYPNLLAYPLGKALGVASVLETGQTAYAWEVSNFVPVEKDKMIIYELLIRDFHEDHSYQSVIEKLDYIEGLGVNVLELMPVNEFEGNSSWGYNPSFYFAPDKYYGHRNDLKKLIDECHKRGIAVVIDMVLNHSFSQSPFAQMYLTNGKPSVNNPWYNTDAPHTCYNWGYDFNHESIYTQELVDSVNSFWINEYKVDGFRFDFTKGFTNNDVNCGWDYDADRVGYLKRMADEIWNRNPNTLVIFEHLADNSEETVLANYGIMLWGNVTHEYQEAAMGYTENNKSDLSWALYKNRGWTEPNLVAYMESHDEERMAFKNKMYGNSEGEYNIKALTTSMERLALNSLFYTLLPGPKMYWQFGELGYDYSINNCPDGSIDEACRVSEKPIRWDYYDDIYRKNLYNAMANLGHLKANYEVFTPEMFDYSLNSSIKTAQWETNGEYAIALGNFDVIEKTAVIDIPMQGTWYNFFDQTTIDLSAESAEFVLQPGEYLLLSTEAMTRQHEIFTVDIPSKQFESKTMFRTYPNPVKNVLHVDLANPNTWIIYDISGKMVLTQENKSNSINIDKLVKGSYLLKLKDTEGNSYSSTFLKTD